MSYCPKCGKEIKDDYNICPNCGNIIKEINMLENTNIELNPKKKHHSGCLISIIVFISLVFFIGIGSNIYTDIDNSEEKNTRYDTSKTYSVGEKLVCPNYEITIDNVQIKPKGTYIDNYQYISDPEWIGVTLTVTNISSSTKTFSSSNIKIINTNGEIIEHSVLTYNIWGVELLNSPELISGGTKTGYIQFSNPSTDNSNLILTVDCSSGLFDETVKYNVNISQ